MLKEIAALSKSSKLSNRHPLEKLTLAIAPIVIIGFAERSIPILINILVFIFLHIYYKNNKNIVLKFTLEIGAFAFFSSLTFIFDYGLSYCIVIILKSINAGLCLSFFSLTTSMDDLLAFFSKFNALRDICDIAKTMNRFIIHIYGELNIIQMAVKSRGGFDGYKQKVIHSGKIGGLLFVNTMVRWKEIKDGIESRCYMGIMPYLHRDYEKSKKREVFIFTYLFFLIFVIYKKF